MHRVNWRIRVERRRRRIGTVDSCDASSVTGRSVGRSVDGGGVCGLGVGASSPPPPPLGSLMRDARRLHPADTSPPRCSCRLSSNSSPSTHPALSVCPSACLSVCQSVASAVCVSTSLCNYIVCSTGSWSQIAYFNGQGRNWPEGRSLRVRIAYPPNQGDHEIITNPM